MKNDFFKDDEDEYVVLQLIVSNNMICLDLIVS